MNLYQAFERIVNIKRELNAVKKLWLVLARKKGIDMDQILALHRKFESNNQFQTNEDSSLLDQLFESHTINNNGRGANISTEICNTCNKKIKCGCHQNSIETVDASTQTNFSCDESAWDTANVTQDVRSAAEGALNQIGFVYDPNTETYYDYHNNCHYIPELKLYYYHQDKCYYYYDTDSKSLKFHSKLDADQSSEVPKDDSFELDSQAVENVEDADLTLSGSEELTSSQEIEPLNPICTNVIIEAGPKPFVADPERHIAPCIRIVVKSTEVSGISIGSLFIVTCSGGTLGREGDHDVVIPDENVSKLHASFTYEYLQNGCDTYKIVDMGSRNGTFLDGIRLSDTLMTSEPFDIVHGSELKVGTTILMCHIHHEFQTCRECEPSFTIKHVKPAAIQMMTRSERETSYKHEIKRLRQKFGLQYTAALASVPKSDGYVDRSKRRRDTIGSSHSSEKTQSSSLTKSIEKSNKGYQLLSKMGWEEGRSIGKGIEGGITSPILPTGNVGREGVGSSAVAPDVCTKEDFRSALIWKKARNRYNQLESLETMMPAIDVRKKCNKGKYDGKT